MSPATASTHDFEPASGIQPIAFRQLWPDTAVVLVVTTDDAFRRRAARAVERAFGARPLVISFAGSRGAALTEAAQSPPDLVLLDDATIAPGDETMTRIRRLPRCERTRIVMTGDARRGARGLR